MPDELGNEPEYVKCSVCGYSCKTNRDMLSKQGTGEVIGKTETSVAIVAGDNHIHVTSTATFQQDVSTTNKGMAFVYSEDNKSRYKFTFTGLTSTTFTGIPTSGEWSLPNLSDTGLTVCDCYSKVRSGCPLCGSLNYLVGSPKGK